MNTQASTTTLQKEKLELKSGRHAIPEDNNAESRFCDQSSDALRDLRSGKVVAQRYWARETCGLKVHDLD